jgi:hypothetical protein
MKDMGRGWRQVKARGSSWRSNKPSAKQLQLVKDKLEEFRERLEVRVR